MAHMGQNRLGCVTAKRAFINTTDDLIIKDIGEGVRASLTEVLADVDPPAPAVGMAYLIGNTATTADPGDGSAVDIVVNQNYLDYNNVKFAVVVHPTLGNFMYTGTDTVIVRVDVLADVVGDGATGVTTFELHLYKEGATPELIGKGMTVYSPQGGAKPIRFSAFVTLEEMGAVVPKIVNLGPQQDMTVQRLVMCMYRVDGTPVPEDEGDGDGGQI